MNKKGVEMTMNTIILAAILLVVLFVLMFTFTKYFGQEQNIVGQELDKLGDCDGDETRNFLDKCPCDPDLNAQPDVQTKLCTNPCNDKYVCKDAPKK